MEIACPHCQTRMKWGEQYWSKRIKCPKCMQIFVIQKPPPTEQITPDNISDIPGSEKADIQVSQQKENKNSGTMKIVKCMDCGESFSKDETAECYGHRMYICKSCFQKGKEKEKSEYRKRILAGLFGCILGVIMIIFAIGIFFEEGGSLLGTAMAGGAIGIGVPALYFGAGCLFSSNR